MLLNFRVLNYITLRTISSRSFDRLKGVKRMWVAIVFKTWRQITRCLAWLLKGNAIHHHSPPSQRAHLHIMWSGKKIFDVHSLFQSQKEFSMPIFPCSSLKKLRTSKLGGTVWKLAQNRLFFDRIASIERSSILSMPVLKSHNIKNLSLIEFLCQKEASLSLGMASKKVLCYMGQSSFHTAAILETPHGHPRAAPISLNGVT